MPVQILTSRDSVVTVIYLFHSFSYEVSNSLTLYIIQFFCAAANVVKLFKQDPDSEPPMGNVIIAPTPTSFNERMNFLVSYKCENVPMRGCKAAATIKNLLWPTNFYPILPLMRTQDGRSSHGQEPTKNKVELKSCRGYILFHDEEDGYRITWIHKKHRCNKTSTQDAPVKISQDVRFRFTSQRQSIITIIIEKTWETYKSDPISGRATICDAASVIGNLCIPTEAYLHIDILLDSLLKRMLSKSSIQYATSNEMYPGFLMPNFYYNLISVSDQGRTVTLVIVFDNERILIQLLNQESPSKAASIGVFIRLDLYDQSYEEIKLVQHPTQNNLSFLRNWCNNLAIHYRYNELGCQEQNYIKQNVMSNRNDVIDGDNRLQKNKRFRGYGKVKKDVQRDYSYKAHVDLSQMYSFCDETGNQAVLTASPVSKIKCIGAPVELRYD